MQFYELCKYPEGDAKTVVWEEEGYNQGDTASCPACGGSIGMLTWLPPYRVILELRGKKFGDFAFFSGGNDFLVSERFRELYEHCALTGLVGFDQVDVIQVKPRRKKRPEPPRYFRVQPVWGGPAIDQAASEFEWLEPPTCSFCRAGMIMRWKRLIIEDGTWQCEDVFRPRGMAGAIMVSERFRALCYDHEISNAEFILADFAGHDFYPGVKDANDWEERQKKWR